MTFAKEIEKFLKPQNIALLFGIIVIGIALCYYTNQKNTQFAGFSQESEFSQEPVSKASPSSETITVAPSVPSDVTSFAQVSGGNASSTVPSLPSTLSNCSEKPTLNASDLLPLSNENSNWAALQTPDVGSPNFLDAGALAGINTVGGSLRNANLQLRSEPPNPKDIVSPWLQSTIEPDLMRTPFEIGCPCPGKSPQ